MTEAATSPPAADEFTVVFADITPGDLPRVGGKGANLGALTRTGIPVPPGYCVTTKAFDQFVGALPDADRLFAALERLDGTDVAAARLAAQAMRDALGSIPVPPAVARAVIDAGTVLGIDRPMAVRSSATAEDLPGASFAGQQDTYLNIVGQSALLDAVRRCWISLFTDRAVLYRARSHFGHRTVRLSVVVQQLVNPEVSGILFTADPISGHRGVISIDAGFGLGEALVSGLISPDRYRVDRKRRAILLAVAGDKALAIRSVPGGGTCQETLPEALRRARTLDDEQVLALADIGARVETLYGGAPQDIEWCLAGGKFSIVQTRPITSLFPIPRAPDADDGGLRVYLSFGHFQMMTDAMPRLAREVWKYFFPAGKGHAPGLDETATLSSSMLDAGSRLYIDATPALRLPRARRVILSGLAHLYQELARMTEALTARPDFISGGSPGPVVRAALRILGPVAARVPALLFAVDPEAAAREAHNLFEGITKDAQARILGNPSLSGRIRRVTVEFNAFFSQVRGSLSLLLSGVLAHRLLARAAKSTWADGVRDEVDRLLRGLPGNVTTEMDLAVGDLTDLVREHPPLAALLREPAWGVVQAKLSGVPGGAEFGHSLERFLDRYGDRGAGEIDVARPRWRDEPSLLFRAIAGGLSGGDPGVHRRKYEAQVAEGEEAARRLVGAARRGPLGFVRRWWIGRLCRVARAGMGLREHPKYALVRLLGAARREVVAAAQTLVQRRQLLEATHVWHLGFDELVALLDDPSREMRHALATRDEAFRADQPRRPPIAMSSDGDTPALSSDRHDLPEGALAGTAASNGVVEGIARVVREPDREVLRAGEILVAAFTDPGWTPLFVHAAAVVTEVGGLMTHGAVVAREYGIPAVVSVEHAMERIQTGQRIRVDGTRGFVLVLSTPDPTPTARRSS